MIILMVSLLETMLEIQELFPPPVTSQENKPLTLLRKNDNTVMMAIGFFMFVLF